MHLRHVHAIACARTNAVTQYKPNPNPCMWYEIITNAVMYILWLCAGMNKKHVFSFVVDVYISFNFFIHRFFLIASPTCILTKLCKIVQLWSMIFNIKFRFPASPEALADAPWGHRRMSFTCFYQWNKNVGLQMCNSNVQLQKIWHFSRNNTLV